MIGLAFEKSYGHIHQSHIFSYTNAVNRADVLRNLTVYYILLMRYYMNPESVSSYQFQDVLRGKRISLIDMKKMNYSRAEKRDVFERVIINLNRKINTSHYEFSNPLKMHAFGMISRCIEITKQSVLK